jgi:hypothetical protein
MLSRSLSEFARCPGCGTRSAQRHLNVAEQVGAVLSRDNRVEGLADAVVVWVSTLAEAQARPVPQSSFGALDHRLDFRAANCLSKGVGSGPDALKSIADGLPDPAADLGQGIG